MTEPTPSGGSSPLRIAGLALLGIGVVAGIIGIATLFGEGDETDPTAAPPPSASAAPDPSAGTAPTPGPTPPVQVPSFPPAPTAAVPPASSPPPGSTGGVGNSDRVAASRVPVRVYNNSTIEGLAAQAAADFEAAGWTVTETKGYPFGSIPTSTVYYRPGTSEMAAAETLANQFGLRSEPRFEGIQSASAGLIVIVTEDYQRR